MKNYFDKKYQCSICGKKYRSNFMYYHHTKQCLLEKKKKDEEMKDLP